MRPKFKRPCNRLWDVSDSRSAVINRLGACLKEQFQVVKESASLLATNSLRSPHYSCWMSLPADWIRQLPNALLRCCKRKHREEWQWWLPYTSHPQKFSLSSTEWSYYRRATLSLMVRRPLSKITSNNLGFKWTVFLTQRINLAT